MNIFRTILLTISDYAATLSAPFRSFANQLISGEHHLISELIDKKLEQQNGIFKTSRNIYLTDLDDTFIDWNIARRSKLWKLTHRSVHRPSNEDIKLFDHAENLIRKLNKQDVHTAIVSNKRHHKLIKQAQHHPWSGLFDRLFGHDRTRAFTMAKNPETILPWFIRYGRVSYPLYAIEVLLGEVPQKGMKPINVVFVGDRLDKDVLTANLLDKVLKKYNPESSCTSILFNSRHYDKKLIGNLPHHKAPRHVVYNYTELEEITDRYFNLKKEEQYSADQKPTAANNNQKPIKKDPQNWIEYITRQENTNTAVQR